MTRTSASGAWGSRQAASPRRPLHRRSSSRGRGLRRRGFPERAYAPPCRRLLRRQSRANFCGSWFRPERAVGSSTPWLLLPRSSSHALTTAIGVEQQHASAGMPTGGWPASIPARAPSRRHRQSRNARGWQVSIADAHPVPHAQRRRAASGSTSPETSARVSPTNAQRTRLGRRASRLSTLHRARRSDVAGADGVAA